MPIPNDYRELIITISEATDKGRVKWSSSSYGYDVRLNDSILTTWDGINEDSERGFVSFAIKDTSGRILDSWYVDEGEPDYDLMRSFWGSVKRQALGIGSLLKSIKSAIDSGKIIGEDSKDDDIVPF